MIQHEIASRAQLQWQPHFESGNATIDMQHRQLFACANRLIEAADAGERDRLTEYLDELVMLTIEHFRDEEALLERFGYADLRHHRDSHMLLLEQALTLRHSLLTSDSSFDEIVRFVTRDIVEQHMLEEDRRYFGLVYA